MSDRPSDFYWEPTYRCGKHPDKAVGFVVKRRGEIYRRACTEKCAIAQAWELQRSLDGGQE